MVLSLLSGTDLVFLGYISGELSCETMVPAYAMAYGSNFEQLWAGEMNLNWEGYCGDQGIEEHILPRENC